MLKTEELSNENSDDSWWNEIINISQKKEESKIDNISNWISNENNESKIEILNTEDLPIKRKIDKQGFAKERRKDLNVPFDQNLFIPTTDLILDDIVWERKSKVFQNKEQKDKMMNRKDDFPQFLVWDQSELKSVPTSSI